MYLVPGTDEIDENEYLVQMALRCRIPSLLPLTISHTDGRPSLRAEVTGCTSIASRYQSVPLCGTDIRKILTSLGDTVRKLPGYLLNPGDLYLAPEYIFLGPGSDEILLCYVPHLSDEDPDTVRLLAEFFLKKLDHSDRIAADLAYGLFDQVAADHYKLGEVLEKLLESSRKTGSEEAFSETFRKSGMGTQDGSRWQEAEPDRALNFGTARGDTMPGRNPGDLSLRAVNTKTARGNPVRRKSAAGGRRNRRPPEEYRKKQEPALKKLLPALIILAAAAALIIVFRMDLTQIGGMGFLCAALIWLTYSTLEKRQTEVHNVWADEDDPGDDAFYQELLKQVYAEDEENRQRAQNAPHMPRRQDWSTQGRTAPQQAEAIGAGIHPQQMTESGTGNGKRCLASLQPERCGDISLESPHLILGKSREKADVVLPDETVSRVHARIEQRSDGWYVSDLYSTNGTYLDERRIASGQAVPLKDGAVLRIGSLKFRVMV